MTLASSALVWFEQVELADVRLPDNHCGMAFDQVERYVELLRAGHRLEPIFVYWDEAERCHWLIDGRHRFVAAMIVGNSKIDAFITDELTMVA